ncbi:MAG: DNA mismatch repair endonuclease MutL [Melioribacteraceae bacterium]|nr:DNA mismatch repair endonuclease MutL [Melioribacteraceae bacterium]
MNYEEIKILPDYIANKIAAGEVVQRPASVLKELIENSLDAGSKKIEVFIKNAGKSLIQVADDGSGMSFQDALKCTMRHATSKIKTVEDLDRITTYGFRGEALSSIAAVSRLELKTERYDDELGTLIRYDDESGLIHEKGSFKKGTSISVKNLFYNTPARRNFLKSNSTELKHLIETFKRAALSNPGVSFQLTNDDDLIFDFSSASERNRLEDVIADNIYDAVVELHEESDFIKIEGCAAKPTYLKKSKGDQYLFINRRYVTSKIINHAVFSAYENILEKGDYPFFVIYLSIDPEKIDINVHPSKLEVKFEDEKTIYKFINAVVKKALGKYDLVPSVKITNAGIAGDKLSFTNYRETAGNDFSDVPNFRTGPGNSKGTGIFDDNEIDLLFDSLNKKLGITGIEQNITPDETRREIAHKSDESENTESKRFGEESSFIISLHNKYILSQIKTGLMIIDQHVAHERILYEKALKSFESNMPFSQQLLFSQSVELDPADYELTKELDSYLTQLGFSLKYLSRRTIEIIGVPSDVNIGSEAETFKDILSEYRRNRVEKNLDVRDNLAKSFSCKTAIKAGDKLNEREMRLLVDQLFATSMPYVCPHGRPIVIKISLTEFDKRFGRT